MTLTVQPQDTQLQCIGQVDSRTLFGKSADLDLLEIGIESKEKELKRLEKIIETLLNDNNNMNKFISDHENQLVLTKEDNRLNKLYDKIKETRLNKLYGTMKETDNMLDETKLNDNIINQSKMRLRSGKMV